MIGISNSPIVSASAWDLCMAGCARFWRRTVYDRFAGDAYDILVATTVVEVGRRVPGRDNHSDRACRAFGLAQLHQLRGRVGARISLQSAYCSMPINARGGESRLRIIRETTTASGIAEEDLRLRGAGDILGVRQSGMPISGWPT